MPSWCKTCGSTMLPLGCSCLYSWSSLLTMLVCPPNTNVSPVRLKSAMGALGAAEKEKGSESEDFSCLNGSYICFSLEAVYGGLRHGRNPNEEEQTNETGGGGGI